MRLGWALVLGLAGGIVVAWWLSREDPAVVQARQARAGQAAAATAAEARPVLYRWRDGDGVLHVSDTPPSGVRAERVDMRPRAGIQVDGSRD